MFSVNDFFRRFESEIFISNNDILILSGLYPKILIATR